MHKIKINLFLCLTEYHAMKTYPVLKHETMKTYVGVRAYLFVFLTLALGGGEWSEWLVPRPPYP